MSTLLNQNQTIAHVARVTGTSWHLLRNIKQKMRNNESFNNRPVQGRPRLSTPAGDRQLKRLVAPQRTAGIQTLAHRWSRLQEKNISAPTVRRRLNELGMKSCVQKRKPFLSESQIQKRRVWCNKMQSWSIQQWSKVVWSDEFHFLLMNRKNRVKIIVASTSRLECKAVEAVSVCGAALQRLVQVHWCFMMVD